MAKEQATLTAWEQRRNANALANNEVLRAVSATSTKIFGASREPKAPKKPAAKKKAAQPVKREAPAPTRRSARVAGIDADPELLKRKLLVESEAKEQEDRAKRLRISGDLDIADIKVEGNAWNLSDKSLASLQMFARGAQPGVRTFTDTDVAETTDSDLKAMRTKMSGLQLYDKFEVKDLKLTKDRVYSLSFHPTEDRALVFAADKEGRMGAFDASQEKPEVDDDDEEAEAMPEILGFKPHSRTISSLLFCPIDANSLYTASYDTSIRKLDIPNGKSTEVYAPGGDDIHSDLAISAIDIATSDPHTLFFSTLDGQLGRVDVRSGSADAELYQLHDLKIGGFSLNPVHPHLLCTASLDRTVKIWDLRKISGKGSLRRPHLVGEHTSRLSVSHAAWSSGGQIATSSYDDTIKLYDFSNAGDWKAGHDISDGEMEPTHIVRHNNQTGRWVTILKPQWQKFPSGGLQKFVIGNMNRFVDVFAANGEQLAQLDGEGITAVPAVAHFHPTMDWVAGGNASGKLTLWM